MSPDEWAVEALRDAVIAAARAWPDHGCPCGACHTVREAVRALDGAEEGK